MRPGGSLLSKRNCAGSQSSPPTRCNTRGKAGSSVSCAYKHDHENGKIIANQVMDEWVQKVTLLMEDREVYDRLAEISRATTSEWVLQLEEAELENWLEEMRSKG